MPKGYGYAGSGNAKTGNKKKGALKKKAKKGFDPRMTYGEPSVTGNTAPVTIGPKEQIIKLSNVPTRGQGTIGASIGKKKAKSSFTRSTGSITAGRSSRSR